MKLRPIHNLTIVFLLAVLAATCTRCAPAERLSLETRLRKYSDYVVPIMSSPTWTMGTGVLVKLPSGHTGIVTNAHVCGGVSGPETPASTIVDGKGPYALRPIRIGSDIDLCVYISNALLPHKALTVTPRDSYKFGEALLVVGFPLNRPKTPQVGFYIAEGMLEFGNLIDDPTECSSKKIAFTPMGFVCITVQKLHQMTTMIYPGNSGSPVFDKWDHLVGIVNSGNVETAQGNFISGKAVSEFLKGL